MAANAPYFQLRGQFTNATATNATFPASIDDGYDLPASLAPTHHASLYGITQTNTLDENHNFVELIEAATTAAGQAKATEAMNTENINAGTSYGTKSQNRSKRKRASSPRHEEVITDTPSGYKRVRMEAPTDPRLQDLGSNTHDGSGNNRQSSSERLLSDARAAGVHSAAALFRRSNSKETTKKHTRPPMSKLFMSLQMTPENFLHLQAQAKAYMLDPAHPERQNCVGNRGKGDSDMVKLRLFNCVRDFLDHGVGEQFFGENVEKPAESETIQAARALGEEKAPVGTKLVWPKDGNKIINLVTPLLRRMVTNERQRMYAIETRKGSARNKEGSTEAVHSREGSTHAMGDSAAFFHSHSVAQQHRQSHISTPVDRMPIASQDIHPQATMSPSAFDVVADSFAPSGRLSDDDGMSMSSAISNPDEHRVELQEIYLVITRKDLKTGHRATFRHPTPLETLTWADLQTKITIEAKKTALRHIHQEIKGIGPETLRGLAVAATKIHVPTIGANEPDSEHLEDLGYSVSSSAIPAIISRAIAHQPLATDIANTDSVSPRSMNATPENASTRRLAPDSTFTPRVAMSQDRGQQPVSTSPALPTHASDAEEQPSRPPSTREVFTAGIKVLLASGLMEIPDGGAWEIAKQEAILGIWANGRLVVVADIDWRDVPVR